MPSRFKITRRGDNIGRFRERSASLFNEITRKYSELAARLMSERVPVLTGLLQRSIRSVRRPDRGHWSYAVEVADVAYYWYYVNYGYHTRSGRFIPARPFVEPTVEEVRPQYFAELRERLGALARGEG